MSEQWHRQKTSLFFKSVTTVDSPLSCLWPHSWPSLTVKTLSISPSTARCVTGDTVMGTGHGDADRDSQWDRDGDGDGDDIDDGDGDGDGDGDYTIFCYGEWCGYFVEVIRGANRLYSA